MIEVVIPAHDAGPFLRETLASVAAQTEPPARITLVDDRSTDDTVAVAEACAREFGERLPLRILRNEGARGPSAARNLAIRESEADAVALLDADDLLEPGHHAALRRALEAAPDIVLAFGDHELFEGGRTLVPSGFAQSGVAALPAEPLAEGVLTLGEGAFPALLRTGIFGTSACLLRRDAAVAAGLFDEEMMHGEDTDLFLRLSLAGRFAFVRDRVARKRVHGGNLTHPRNAMLFCRGTVRSLTKLMEADRAAPVLSPARRAALTAALPGAVGGHLYAASRTGLRAYAEAAAMATRAGQGRLAARPRNLLRLALRPFLPEPPARPAATAPVRPAAGPPVSVCVFAYNEEASITACLDAFAALAGEAALRVHVLINGCTDGTERVVRAYRPEGFEVHPVVIRRGDKANAWNTYVHEVAPADAVMHVFTDGDMIAAPGTVAGFLERFAAEPEADGCAALPISGRSRDAFRDKLRRNREMAGNLYALRDRAVAAFRDRGVRLPFGMFGEDGLVTTLVKYGLDPLGPRDDRRVTATGRGGFAYPQLSPLSPRDWRTYRNRRMRYAVRRQQANMLYPLLFERGIAAMPAHVVDLYRERHGAMEVRRNGVDAYFDRVARDRILRDVAAADAAKTEERAHLYS